MLSPSLLLMKKNGVQIPKGIADGCRRRVRQRRDAHVSGSGEMDFEKMMEDAMAAAQDALAGGGLDLDSLMGGLGDLMGGLADGSGLGGLGTNVNLDLATSMDELGLGGTSNEIFNLKRRKKQ